MSGGAKFTGWRISGGEGEGTVISEEPIKRK